MLRQVHVQEFIDRTMTLQTRGKSLGCGIVNLLDSCWEPNKSNVWLKIWKKQLTNRIVHAIVHFLGKESCYLPCVPRSELNHFNFYRKSNGTTNSWLGEGNWLGERCYVWHERSRCTALSMVSVIRLQINRQECSVPIIGNEHQISISIAHTAAWNAPRNLQIMEYSHI